jgi:hypothetical protein
MIIAGYLVCLSAVLILRFIFFRTKADKNILYLLIGLTLTFISLTAPIQLHGNHITIFWPLKLFYCIGFFKSRRFQLYELLLLFMGFMMVSLVMDWAIVYVDESNILPIIANKGFITTLYCSIANYVLFLLRRKDIAGNETDILSRLVRNENIFRILSVALLFLAGSSKLITSSPAYTPLQISITYILLYFFLCSVVYCYYKQGEITEFNSWF